jgi:hypothetical protein
MKAIWCLLLCMALALALVAADVFGLGDRHILVSPPDAVTEGFVRELVTNRYEMALPYLSDDLAQQVNAEQLKQATQQLRRRTGRISNVTGEEGWIKGDQAAAGVLLDTEKAGELHLHFRLTREQGEWAVSDLRELR